MAMELGFFYDHGIDISNMNGSNSWGFHIWEIGYPLVNVYIANWKDPPFFMGKTYFYGHFQVRKLLVYQRVLF